MAVITQITLEEAQAFCKNLDLNIIDLKGIVAGTENSTFLIKDTSEKKYILTIFEQGNLDDINFVCNLQSFLNAKNLPVLVPKQHKNGDFFALLKNKPCLVFDFAEGFQVLDLNLQAAKAAALYLAQQHNATTNYAEKKPHLRYLDYILENQHKLASFLNTEDKNLMFSEIAILEEKLANANLPEAVLHGDLFRDNVFFTKVNSNLTINKIIDFYNSCTGARIYDLAVLVCDWAIDEQTNLHKDIYRQIIQAYKSVVKFSASEEKNWLFVLRLVAVRYWISRLLVVYLEAKSDRIAKDPNHFKNILIKLKDQTQYQIE